MKPIGIRLTVLALLAAFALAGAGCGTVGVEAWDRGTLAQYGMRLDRDPLAVAMSEHTFFSREASAGGRGVGGTGCGCN